MGPVIKSDGNGGSHIPKLTPAWIAILISLVLMLFTVGGTLFGFSFRRGVQEQKICDLEKGRDENKANISKLGGKIDTLNVKIERLIVIVDSHVKATSYGSQGRPAF